MQRRLGRSQIAPAVKECGRRTVFRAHNKFGVATRRQFYADDSRRLGQPLASPTGRQGRRYRRYPSGAREVDGGDELASNDATMMKTFATASVVLLFVLGASSARAGFDEGLAAHRRGDYATALRASSVRWPSSATRRPSSTSAPCKRTAGACRRTMPRQ